MKKKSLILFAHALTCMAALTAVAKDELTIQIDNSYIHDVAYTKKIVFLTNLETSYVPNGHKISNKKRVYVNAYEFSESSEIELANFYDNETGMPCVILTGQGVIKAYTSYQSLAYPDAYVKAHLNIIITGDQATGCRVYQVI